MLGLQAQRIQELSQKMTANPSSKQTLNRSSLSLSAGFLSDANSNDGQDWEELDAGDNRQVLPLYLYIYIYICMYTAW